MHFLKLLSITAVAIVLAGCGDSNDCKAGESSSTPKVTAGSQLGELGPQGLFDAVQPGWHSAQPAKYPESLTVDFQIPREVQFIGLLQQEGQPTRAPKSLRIEISSDGKTWTAVGGSENACAPNIPDGWFNIDLAKPITAQHMKIVIFSNCGDAQLLTLRGLRVG